MSETTSCSVDAHGIATLTIDVPDRAMNVFTPALVEELESFVEMVAENERISGAIITSGKATFIAGADLKAIVDEYDKHTPIDVLWAGWRPFTKLLRRLETGPKPFVAAINGTALGGGLELCLSCHYRVAANNPEARLGLPEVNVGLIPGAGGTQRLPRLIGVGPALELMVEGKLVNPDQARELGFVDAVVPAEELMETARQLVTQAVDSRQPWDKAGFEIPGGSLASDLAVRWLFAERTALIAKGTQRNYPAPIALTSAVFEGLSLPMDAALRVESRYLVSLLNNPVHRNLIRTLFINKKAAEKLAARPNTVERSEVRVLGVPGAGMMGAGIAYVAAEAGIEVVLLDVTKEKAEHGKLYSAKLLERAVERGRLDEKKASARLDRIRTTADYDDLKDADLVIEAVFENRDIKAAVTRSTEAVIRKSTLLASNTSTLPISGLAEASTRPEQFIGLHFFSPVDRMSLVEVILGKTTSTEALAKALDFIKQIGKTPIVVNDSRGFYTSRVFSTYVNEGMVLLKDGVLPALIENAGRQAGMPVGPLAVHDEVTLELLVKIHNQGLADLGDDYTPPSAIDVAVEFVERLDRKGRPYGKGFYDYPKDAPKRLWARLKELFPPADTQPSVEVVKQRLLFVQALETFRCYDEGVLTDPADADIGSILGWGFPAYTGGTLSFIDTVGIRPFVEQCDRLAELYGERFEVPPALRERAAAGRSFHAPAGEGY